MSDMKQKLRDLEAEVRASQAPPEPMMRAGSDDDHPALRGRKKRPMKSQTKRKVLIGAALVLTFLLVWKKVHINFVVFTSFWGFLGIVAVVFLLLYGVLHFFFDSSGGDDH